MSIDKSSVTNTFTAGTTIRSAEVNTNYQDIETPLNSLVDVVSAPVDGYAYDYQISTGIASSDLTISLLKMDGTSYSASNKGYIRIANTLLDIDSALSVTLDNADGDYFGWDGGKIQGKDCQLFVLLANNSGNLRIGVSPDPTKTTCGANRFYSSAQQGSAGHTNGVWSGTVASTDPCRVIGRINVNQSDADAWTAPSTASIVNYPIYSTDWLDWTPSYTFAGTAPTTISTGFTINKYKVADGGCYVRSYVVYGSAGNANTEARISAPITAKNDAPTSSVHSIGANVIPLSLNRSYVTGSTIYISLNSISLLQFGVFGTYPI